jgi:hypothetical protein
MANKIRLITHENGILEVEPDEIEMLEELFYVNTTIPYCVVILQLKGDEDFDNNRIFKVNESKAEIENQIRHIEQRIFLSQIRKNSEVLKTKFLLP